MQESDINTINKLNIPITGGTDSPDTPNVLWLSSFCSENKDSLNFRPHNHTFFEVHFGTQGSICYRFDDVEVTVDEGSYVLIPPHCIHCITSHTEDFQKVTLSFEVTPESDLYYSLMAMTKRACPTGPDLGTSLDFIIRRATVRTPYMESIIKCRIAEAVYLIAASSAYRPASMAGIVIYDPRVLKAKKFIEDNPQIFLTCDEVAQHCRLSPKQLGRLFYQYESCSLLAFIHGQKIESAKKLIRESGELFEIISERLGFSSVNYFGKFFARCTGMTPGEYRKSTEEKK
ncbi:MAG: helix-turn-helix domain-containing protein [Clostridia bacterium]|nr:helix-turn-helix domain-containing protein [Clostridia bacterium]